MNINEIGVETRISVNLTDRQQCISFQFQKLTKQHGQNQMYSKKRQEGQKEDKTAHLWKEAAQKSGRQSTSTAPAI